MDKYIVGQIITSVVVVIAVIVNHVTIRREAVRIRLAAAQAADKIEARALAVNKELEATAERVRLTLEKG